MIWEGVRRFVEWGLEEYDMYGGGKATPGVAAFKASFGSTYSSTSIYCKSFSRTFGALLNLYEHIYLRLRKYPAHN